jgi:hypothetical protein
VYRGFVFLHTLFFRIHLSAPATGIGLACRQLLVMADPTRPAMPDSTQEQPPPAASRPRQASLLPAFEPLSSSPVGLPRATKRKFDELLDDRKYYPTPVPTSSTGILPSSPPSRQTRPAIQRAVSTLSERAPLGDVPTLDLPANGEPVLMGRSSNSSDYQLSANRHISRVHVRASYHPPDDDSVHGKVEVECLGWNGAKVHCRGEVVELAKGDVFVSDKPMAQIMVDVQDTRVLLVWPKEDSNEPPSIESRSPWAVESPTKRRTISAPQPQAVFASSPPVMLPPRPRSPVSPTPAAASLGVTFTSTFVNDESDEGPVKVYEDHSSDEVAPHDPTPEPVAAKSPTKRSTPTSASDLKQSNSTLASEGEDFSEHDEENDPIVHSFGPFGDNILNRFQSFQSKSPEQQRKPLRPSLNSPGRSHSAPSDLGGISVSPVKNHVINQLAFSRIHSLPLSTIHSNLPAELRGAMAKPSDSENRKVLTTSELKTILDEIPCVGEISREGKDAAGKLLESEFYYQPEMDEDTVRREAVMQSLGKTSIRAARKSHKVCCRLVSYLPSLRRYLPFRCSNTTGSARATEHFAPEVTTRMLYRHLAAFHCDCLFFMSTKFRVSLHTATTVFEKYGSHQPTTNHDRLIRFERCDSMRFSSSVQKVSICCGVTYLFSGGGGRRSHCCHCRPFAQMECK